MKKILLLGVPAVLAVLLVVFGPRLLDTYRLMSFIETRAEADRASGGPWPQLNDVCTVCHGIDGNSRHPGYPDLAGQPAEYVAEQLRRFASRERADPNMSPLAMTLSEAEIEQLSDYYAKQPIRENRSFDADPELRKEGRRLVKAGGCAACHGGDFMGQGRNPRLAAQGHTYLVAQLDAYAEGTRKAPEGVMNDLAASASARERRAMALYLASLVPEQRVSSQGIEE